MAKRRPIVRGPRSKRDRALSEALLVAAQHTSADVGSSFIVRLPERAEPTIATPPKQPRDLTAAETANLNTSMALAMAKAELAPATQAKPVKATTPSTPSNVSTVAPAPETPPRPAPGPSYSKSTRSKATAKQAANSSDAKKTNRPRRLTRKDRAAAAQANDAQILERRRAKDERARADRMAERHKAAARTIAMIGQASSAELLVLWRANITSLGNDKSAFRDLARDYVIAIESEWTRRSIIARLDPDYFQWPSTNAAPGNGTFAALEHTEGILGYLGYHVGKTGESSSARRHTLLARAFEGPLPPINGPDYMREWDDPASATRLEKMAVSLASAVKSAKRRTDADYSVAIGHWEEDLKFLHRVYYIGQFGFDWPGGISGGSI